MPPEHALAFLFDHIAINVGTGASSWFPALGVLFFLGLGAVHDARTGRVPDLYTACAGAIAVAMQILTLGGARLAERAAIAAAVWAGLWLLNTLYYLWRKQDGLGMGDAKWLSVAVLAFGPQPALTALFVGAWMALIAMAFTRNKNGAVHFAPFLFFGLLAGIAFF